MSAVVDSCGLSSVSEPNTPHGSMRVWMRGRWKGCRGGLFFFFTCQVSSVPFTSRQTRPREVEGERETGAGRGRHTMRQRVTRRERERWRGRSRQREGGRGREYAQSHSHPLPLSHTGRESAVISMSDRNLDTCWSIWTIVGQFGQLLVNLDNCWSIWTIVGRFGQLLVLFEKLAFGILTVF